MNFVTVKNETELDGLLTKQYSLRLRMDSDLESETMPEFIVSVFPGEEDRHCSLCKHYEICTNFTMYCHVLQRRITARKKPCRHFEM